MASRLVLEKIALKNLRCYHHSRINEFDENESLIESISNRVAFFGASPIAFLSLLARRPLLHHEDLEDLIMNDRSLLRASAFHGALYLFCTQDYSLYFRAIHGALQQYGMARLQKYGLSLKHVQEFEKILTEENFETPQSDEKIINLIFGRYKSNFPLEAERLVIRKLCDTGVLIRTSIKGFKSNEFSFALTKNWIGLELNVDSPESARTELVRRYLRCYGPAAMDDIIHYTGFSLSQVQRSLVHLRREITTVSVDSLREELYILRESIDLLRKTKDFNSNRVLFLPSFDPYAYARSNYKHICDKVYAPWVFDQNKNPASLIILRGKVVGIWQFREGDISILEYHIFDAYKSEKELLEIYALSFLAQLKELTYSRKTSLLHHETLPAPLAEREEQAFLWPLGRNLHKSASSQDSQQSMLDRRNANTFRNSYLDGIHKAV